MKLKTIYILFLTISVFVSTYGQNNIKLPITENSIEEEFNTAKELIKNNEFVSYKQGIELIDELEKSVKKSNQLKLRLAFYRQKSLFLFENYDYDNALKYIHKSINDKKHPRKV